MNAVKIGLYCAVAILTLVGLLREYDVTAKVKKLLTGALLLTGIYFNFKYFHKWQLFVNIAIIVLALLQLKRWSDVWSKRLIALNKIANEIFYLPLAQTIKMKHSNIDWHLVRVRPYYQNEIIEEAMQAGCTPVEYMNYAINACVKPQQFGAAFIGEIAITPASFKYLDLNEIIFIMSHEISHMILGHFEIYSWLDKVPLIRQKRQRDREVSADKCAVKLMQEAGIPPEYAISCLSKMGMYEKHLSWWERIKSDHPPSAKRIEILQKFINSGEINHWMP